MTPAADGGHLVADPQVTRREVGLEGQVVRPVVFHHRPGARALGARDRHVLDDLVTQPSRLADIPVHPARGWVPLGPEPGRGDDVEHGVDGAVRDEVVAHPRHGCSCSCAGVSASGRPVMRQADRRRPPQSRRTASVWAVSSVPR